jgi:hypothetical protein
MSTAAVGSGQPTPAEALAQPLPDSLAQPREKNAPNPGQLDAEQATLPPISSVVTGSRLFDLSVLSALVGIQVVWLALIAFVFLAFVR